MANTIIAYSLAYLDDIKAYVPSAYFVEEQKDGTIGYMVARAVPANMVSYGVQVEGTIHGRLVTMCEDLSVEALTLKYGAAGRRRTTLAQAFEDSKKKVIITQYVQRMMQRFLEEIHTAGYPLCLEIERKVFLEDIRIRFASSSLAPSLSFEKKEEGIDYELKVHDGQSFIRPSEHDVHILLNTPGYILIDYVLFRLEEINGNKLKPFLQKKVVFIPEHLTRTYFEKFIMDVVNKVDIDATGFDIEQHQSIKGVSTSFDVDLFDDRFVMDLVFDYGESFFLGSNPTQRRNRLYFGAKDRIAIRQIVRSEDEKKYYGKLQEHGLELNSARRLVLPNVDSKYGMIQWIIDHKEVFSELDVELKPPLIGGKMVCLEPAKIFLNTVALNDWFDIQGTIEVGDHTLYFTDLILAIKQGDQFLELPDGHVFLIPDAWMTQYSSLANFGERNGDQIRIKKSQYGLVEGDEDLEEGVRKMVVSEEDIDYVPSKNLLATLRPYQTEGVKWLLKHQQNQLGACLADDMGLGKTLQTLAVLCYTKDHLDSSKDSQPMADQLTLFAQEHRNSISPLQTLIILPASLVFNWAEEIRKFAPKLSVCNYIGVDRKNKKIDLFDVVLTTYQTALRAISDLQAVQWKYIILDESHMIKNKESKIFKAVNTLRTENKISLSGTPIENSLADLWSQMQFINPDMLGSFSFFKQHFLVPIQKHSDESALTELRSLVEPFILRRRKKDVAKDLPELMEKVTYVSMTRDQAECFEEEKSAARNQLLGIAESDPEYKFFVFRSLLRLRQIANHPVLMDETYEGSSGKFEQILDHLDSVMRAGHKVLVFSSFTSHLDLISSQLKEDGVKFCMLTGKTSQVERQRQVHLFQEDSSFSIFLISIKAGGTGLNLTQADYVFILDPWWNPFVEEQAVARAHRIGRENPISVIRFISKDSIEEKIIKLQATKKVLSAELIEDQQQINIAKEDLRYLLS